jgi:hypothetical protein
VGQKIISLPSFSMFLEYVIVWGVNLYGVCEMYDLLKLITIFQPFISRAKPHKANDSGIIRSLMHPPN